MKRAPLRLLEVFCVLYFLASFGLGCADDTMSSMRDAGTNASSDVSSYQPCYGANDCPPGYYCNTFRVCAPMDNSGDDGGAVDGYVAPDLALPPEVENNEDPPAGGLRYMYVAIASKDKVVKIDSQTLKVRSYKVGSDPGALRTIKGKDVAVVLNRQSSTATVLRSKVDGGDDLVTLKTASNLNNLAISPLGKWALAFFDVSRSLGNLGAKQNFQDVTLLKLEPGKEQAINLTVGFKPSGVQFSADESKVFVITAGGISIISPAQVKAAAIAPTVLLLKDPISEPTPDEVLVTPDGKLALLRQKGVKGIRSVDLNTGILTDIPLKGEATDLDLTNSGDMLVAVLRNASEVALIDIPADLSDPTKIDTLSTGVYTAGQAVVPADGKSALLFSNATSQEVLMIADLATRKLKIHPLKKGVRNVVCAPDGKSAVVQHNKAAGQPSKLDSLDQYIDKSYGYSLLAISLGFSKLLLTGSEPGPIAFAPDSLSAYLLLNKAPDKAYSVEAVDLGSFLVKDVSLGSRPVAHGVLAGTQKVYVTQDHSLGRVTFIDIKTRETKTVTGFELNSDIIE